MNRRIVAFIAAYAVLALAACRKYGDDIIINNGTRAINPEHYIFGVSGGLCGSCYHFYKMEGGAIYEDSILDVNNRVFKVNPLPESKYQIAKSVFDYFPVYLDQNPDKDFRCNGCADQRVYYIELKENGITHRWNIDEIRDVQPEPIKNYVHQLEEVINEIK